MRKPVIAIAIGLTLLGCREEAKDPGPTLVVVNGQAITAEMLKEQVLVQAKLLELGGKPVSEAALPKWGNEQSIPVMRTLLCGTLIEQEMAARGLKAEAEDVDKILTAYNKAMKQDAKDFEALARTVGDLREPFRRHLEMNAALTFYNRKFWVPTVTDLMVRQHINFMSNRVERAAAIDAEARKKADAAHKRLKSGEKWEKVARECSEDKLLNPENVRFAKEWVSMGPTAVGMPALAKVLPTLEEGGFTEPIETRDGMLIVRFLGMRGELYRTARILFRMAQPVAAPRSEAAARKELEEELLVSNRQQTLDVLWKKAKLEYPLGTNFTYKIWQ